MAPLELCNDLSDMGVDLRDVWRGGPVEVAEVARRAAGLKPGARVYQSLGLDQSWDATAHLVAQLVDEARRSQWLAQVLASEKPADAAKKIPEPERELRPSQIKAALAERASRDAAQEKAQARLTEQRLGRR